jgi:peptidoglycan DL-endopeptidase CwlO
MTLLSSRLAEIYKQGDGEMLTIILGADSFSQLVNRMGLLERIGSQDSKLVKQVNSRTKKVAEHKAKLDKQLKQEKAQATAVKAAKQAVEKKLADNQKLLKGKQAQIAELERQEQARQAQLAAQAREAARKAAQQAAVRAQQARVGSLPGAKTTTLPVSGSSKGAKAVQIAMRYLGVPYVWAGASPRGFDCSGLVLYVYAQLGVSLPHSAAMQYNCGTHISRDQLEPGDLVFYGRPIHHVGIYVGNGRMIDAPHAGSVVQFSTINGAWIGGRYLPVR